MEKGKPQVWYSKVTCKNLGRLYHNAVILSFLWNLWESLKKRVPKGTWESSDKSKDNAQLSCLFMIFLFSGNEELKSQFELLKCSYTVLLGNFMVTSSMRQESHLMKDRHYHELWWVTARALNSLLQFERRIFSLPQLYTQQIWLYIVIIITEQLHSIQYLPFPSFPISIGEIPRPMVSPLE